MQQVYNRFVKPDLARSELIYQKKKLVIETMFRGELETLGYILSLLAEQDRQARDVPQKRAADNHRRSNCLPAGLPHLYPQL